MIRHDTQNFDLVWMDLDQPPICGRFGDKLPSGVFNSVTDHWHGYCGGMRVHAGPVAFVGPCPKFLPPFSAVLCHGEECVLALRRVLNAKRT